MMVGKMKETFGDDVVIVPSLGNNDIYREFGFGMPAACSGKTRKVDRRN